MFTFLTVVQALVAAALVGAILMQRSEGGGLTGGGNPSGMVSARGAADLMTRTTAILALFFVLLSIALAVLAVNEGKGSSIDTSFERQQAVDPLEGESLPLELPGAANPLDAQPSEGAAAPAIDSAAPAEGNGETAQ